jgi:hypothetical protein
LIEANELATMEIRDLRWFVQAHGLPLGGLNTKPQLMDLISKLKADCNEQEKPAGNSRRLMLLLSSLKSEKDVEELNINELKGILDFYSIDYYTRAAEKPVLVDQVKRLCTPGDLPFSNLKFLVES